MLYAPEVVREGVGEFLAYNPLAVNFTTGHIVYLTRNLKKGLMHESQSEIAMELVRNISRSINSKSLVISIVDSDGLEVASKSRSTEKRNKETRSPLYKQHCQTTKRCLCK
jgi:hypothetical protein